MCDFIGLRSLGLGVLTGRRISLFYGTLFPAVLFDSQQGRRLWYPSTYQSLAVTQHFSFVVFFLFVFKVQALCCVVRCNLISLSFQCDFEDLKWVFL